MTKGEKIKSLRISKGLSQIELANILNTTKQNIYKYETGIITNIPSDKIEQMARIFKVSPSYIMGWNDDTFADETNNINVKNQIKISSHELNVIEAYRNKPDMQPVVDKILDVSTTTNNSNPDMREIQNKCDNKTHLVYKAARSNSGKQADYIEVSQEKLDRLKDAPETDDDFS